VFGLETMQALSQTNFLICGLGGVGVEVGTGCSSFFFQVFLAELLVPQPRT
jgi:hypothetical protein